MPKSLRSERWYASASDTVHVQGSLADLERFHLLGNNPYIIDIFITTHEELYIYIYIYIYIYKIYSLPFKGNLDSCLLNECQGQERISSTRKSGNIMLSSCIERSRDLKRTFQNVFTQCEGFHFLAPIGFSFYYDLGSGLGTSKQ